MMKKMLPIALTLAALLPAGAVAAAVSVDSLRCEYLENPLGIDVGTPRFFWQLKDSQSTRGQRQTAYRILVASSPALLAKDQADVWDSGAVASSQSTLVPYAGPGLASNQDCYWKVRVWDKDKQLSPWSAPSRFSMGLLNAGDWTGPWIKHPDAAVEKHLWFRKNFTLPQPATTAFVHVASIGYHELYVNGKKADDTVLAPALTRLDRRVLSVTYDVAKFLQPGVNTLALWTGPGWARYAEFKTVPALRVQLNAMNDKGLFSLASDATWRCAVSSSENSGPYNFGDYGGEKLDASRETPDWNVASFDDRAWSLAVEAPIKAAISAQMIEPTRVLETIPAQSILDKPGNAYRLDLGKNFTGWLEIKMNAQTPGDIVIIQVADDIGTVQDFGQRFEYVCKGGSGDRFRNRFNYSAGRYVMIQGLKAKPQLADVTGYALGSDIGRTGRFTSSKELFNRIYETDLWTYHVNTTEGYTTDCPHRERLGYGEVAFANAWGTSLPNYLVGALYTKNIRDWSDVQQDNGWIPHTAPQANEKWGGPLWSSAGLNMTWAFYQTYGDKRVLELNYPSARRWLEFLNKSVKQGVLERYTGHNGHFLGDWAAPGQRKEFGNTPEAQFFNNCVYALNLKTFVQIAQILGRSDDVALYGERLKELRTNAHAKFFHPETHTYSNGNQVQQAFALLAGITPENLRPAVAAVLEKDITHTQPYIDAGSSGLPVLLSYLIEESDRADLLFAPLSKTTEPSYGYFLERGETAWPEYWNVNVTSRMHTCYTGIASWFTKGVAGLRPDPAQPGGQAYLIKPTLTGDLTFTEAGTESLYGPITSRWEKNAGIVIMKVTIPPNSTATVHVPMRDVARILEGTLPAGRSPEVKYLRTEGGAAVFAVGSGTYRFSSDLN